MAKPRHLARAPIIEAVLDIGVAPRQSGDFTALQKAFESLDFGYKQQSFVVSGTLGFVINPEAEVQQSGQAAKIGLRLQSQDEKYVALVRTNGFSLSRLAPYENWDALQSEARKIWEIYVKRWTPDKVVRLATRYINNLRLPLAIGQSFSNFINTLTELPPEVPQSLGQFVQQFQCLDPSSRSQVRLSLAWNGQVDNGRIPVILDIDVSTMQQFDPADAAMWSQFRSLRELKNRCFFGTLQEEALKEYT